MKKQLLPKNLFDKLIAAVNSQYAKDCEKHKTQPLENITDKWSGQSEKGIEIEANQAPQKPKTIRDMLLCCERVQNYLQKLNKDKTRSNQMGFKDLNGKKLYDFQHISEKAHEHRSPTLERNEFVLHVLLLYLGYENWEEFVEKNLSPSAPEPPPTDEKLISFFKCYYYSFKSHKVKHFKMQFDESVSPMTVEEIGWHDETNNKLKGTATRKDTFIFVNLDDASTGFQWQMTLAVGTRLSLAQATFISASMTAISTHNWISTAQVIMVKANSTYETALSKKEKLKIKKHLILKAHNFRIKNEYIPSTANLNMVRKRDLTRLNPMVGLYRIWSYDRRARIYQAYLLIRPDFRAFYYTHIYTEKEKNKQVCLLRFSDSSVSRLCITTYPAIGVGVLGYCITQIPPDEQTDILRGGFMTMGDKDRDRPIIGFIFLKKEPTLLDCFDENDDIVDEKRLSIGILDKAKIPDMIKEDPRLARLYELVQQQLVKVKLNDKEEKEPFYTKDILTATRHVLAVKNLAASVQYYKEELGFKTQWHSDGWHQLARDRFVVMLGECADDRSAFETRNHAYFAYVDVDNVDNLHAELRQKQVDIIYPLGSKPWGMREFGIQTIDGHRIMFAQKWIV
jgi:catechol 2,3-dioxygenase-like lactoylglutathione lyase family enzyme